MEPLPSTGGLGLPLGLIRREEVRDAVMETVAPYGINIPRRPF